LRVVTSVKTVNKRHGLKKSKPEIGNDLKEINAETYQNETVGVSISKTNDDLASLRSIVNRMNEE
jgi:hypothetical protein